MPFGIQNIGQTCYLNSALQAIHSSPVLKKALEQYKGECLFIHAVKNINIPKILENLPQFTLGQPHDTHEVLLAIIDKLEKDLDKSLFYGTSESTFITRDGKKTITQGLIGPLMLQGGTTLDEAYKKSLGMEYMVDTSAGTFVCKQTRHVRLPQILVCVITNAKPIEIPDTFHGRNLNCVIIHAGNHYVSVVKEGDDMFLIDDDKIFKVEGLSKESPVYLAIYS